MSSKIYFLFSLSLLLGCGPSPNPPGIVPSPSASPSSTPAPAETPMPSATVLPSPSSSPVLTTPNRSTPVALASGQPGVDLSILSSVELKVGNPFLDGMGETTLLQPLLKDKQGQPLDPFKYPLEWLSSRPSDFAIDASGKVTALVEYGFTTIYLKIPGTSLMAQQQISVNTLAATGGSSAPKPTRESIKGGVKFEF